jgi:hypothetical protein
MRALPILVDLFVLLTIFGLTLFFVALGNSAPSAASVRQIAIVELIARLVDSNGVEEEVEGLISFEAQLINADGTLAPTAIYPTERRDGRQLYQVLNFVEGMQVQFVIRELDPKVFDWSSVSVELVRHYPGSMAIGPIVDPVGRASLFRIPVAE